MTITLELPDELAARLDADAARRGLNEAELLRAIIAGLYADDPSAVNEGSAEEVAAVHEALDGPFHPFVPQAAAERMRAKHGLGGA